MGLISIVTSIAIAVAPLIVYTDQIISIVKSKSSKDFSSFICLILLLSNITRILFWFGNHFEIALLVQSILLIVCMFILQYTCVHYSQSNNKGDTFNLSGDNNSNSNRNLKLSLQSCVRDFWMWSSFKPYLVSVGVYTSFMTVLYIFLGSYDWFVGLLGYIALGLEATLPIPQFINNYKQKSLKGFRYTVLLGWLFGDSVSYRFLK